MKKIFYTRKFWIPLIVLLISIVSIVLYNIREVLINNWFETINIVVGIVGLITTLFNYWNKFNLFFTRLWIIITNNSSIWNVSANFEGEFNETDFKKVIYKLKTMNIPISDFFEVNSKYIRMNINGLNYTFEYIDVYDSEEGLNHGKIHCRIIDFNSSYDHSIKIFEQDIIPYLGIFETSLKPEKSNFTFKISFDGKNPFLRLITKNLDTKVINSLWYSAQEKTTTGVRDIRISEKSIECTTSNIIDFQSSSVNFISLVGG